MAHGGTRSVIFSALAANLFIAVAKFVAAYFTRSSAMLAEGFHSLADTTNQLFLLLGITLAARPPDAKHHFGHAQERYFWAFVVAITIFTVGAAFSLYEGIHKILHFRDPEQALHHALWGVGVLGVSIVFEAISWTVAFREFSRLKGARPVVQAISDARDPVILTVLFEDSAALLGLITALAGLGLAWATGNMIFDGLASLLVGFMLAAVAFILARETKDLLLGESVVSADAECIRAIVTSFPLVQKLVTQRTMHLGPDEVLLVLKLEFVDTLNTAAIEAAIDEIERRLRQELPLLKRIWIEPGTGSSAIASRGTRETDEGE